MDEIEIILVEDDPAVREGSAQALDLAGFNVRSFDSAEPAHELLCPHRPCVLVSDVRLPGMGGLELLQAARAVDPDLPVILVTGHGDIAMAVQAMRDGAYDFLEKPYSSDQLADVVRRAVDKRRLQLEVQALRQRLAHSQGIDAALLGNTAAMRDLRRLILEVASQPADVLVYGETGTGKELVARCLHRFSERARHHYVAVNCGAIPETIFESELFGHEAGAFTGAARRQVGKIEHASDGTLFLDEIESLPPPLQVKLLRVLQERYIERLGSVQPVPVDVRVVAAAKVDLRELVDQGQFRADLYYRLNLIVLRIPPLRERRDDIPLLFEHFMLDAASRYRRDVPALPPAHRQVLLRHDWPGNVRELRNAADRYVLGLPGALPGEAGVSAAPATPASLSDQVSAFERALIDTALREAGGNVSAACASLAVPKQTLYHKMQKYGLAAEHYR
ncbi:sigma-54-dependent transcriptional regulator [Pseudoduganella plicata]|uniref:Sigma-54-dependent Fis family transcriptional regulator n=1 Tax=Pseudoduganella plicata TaxID=321984 RepID=A0A4P7BBN8_9BURK|nr:sigma-54 dependent transcriptional regulator [Pseudoduganella plicata]QBQ35352.1 sigma-54-dependent Fis family transcriptional regulator [Pseudoduganella plicata]GGZ01043.1 sigma-54-dependent Fis family transcriptional regulator [Pseudoduganella plicata]